MAGYSNPISIGTALIALAIMIAIGLRGSRKFTEEEYLIGGRKIGAWLLAGTMAAGVIGGGVLLVFFEYVFRYGLSAFWIIGGLVVGLVCLNWIAVRYKPLADKQGFYTLPDLYRFFWGPTSGVLATAIIFAWTCGFIIMQLISAGTVLHAMTGWNYNWGVVIAAATVGSYLLASGYKAVVATDVAQYCALLVVLVLFAFFALPAVGVSGLHSAVSGASLNIGDAIGFFLLGALNIIVSADLWQRVYSAKSASTARWSMYLAALLVLLAGLLLFVPGFYARIHLATAVPNEAAIDSMNLLFPAPLLGLGLVGVLSTIISALDTMVFVLSISVAHDIGVRQLGAAPSGRRRNMRVIMFCTLAGGAVLAILDDQLLTTGLALSSLGLILAPSILMQLTKWKPPARAVVFGMLLGIVCTVALIVTGNLTPEYAVGTLVAAMAGTALGYVGKRNAA
ncbi:MAG: hypothetical protein WCA78_09645 [Rhizomicrobium sp.]